jgi:cystathionine beta-lyase
MNYNFDEIIERRGTGCVKWDETPAIVHGSMFKDQRSKVNVQRPMIPLWVADMDFAVAPAIQEAICRRAEHPVFGYTYVQDDYYNAVISWFKRRHQWTIEREWMLYTTGVVPAMSVAIKALTMPGEKVLILTPDYNCFFSSVRNNGCEVAESVLRFACSEASKAALQFSRSNRFEVDWADFEQQCADEKTTVFLLCNPHNPTSRVWTREELKHMADICHRHHVRIVSDEIHCELVMPGHTFVPMGTVDADAIILNSPSKSFNIAGLQMANIICRDAETRRRLNRAININEVCDVNPFAPEAVKAAYNDSEDWIDCLNAYLWDNYRSLCDFVAQQLPLWRVKPLEGTYLVWVDVSACCDSVATYCEQLLQETRVWLNPGTMYGLQSGEGYLRINIACPRTLLMEALQRIAHYSQHSHE